jgi:type II secretory pathway pseudopilin PulG
VSGDGPAAGARPRPIAEEGSTLVEVLLALVFVSLAGVAVLTGLATGIRGGDTHQKQAAAGAAVVSAAERLKDPAVARVPCATPATASYLTAARTVDLPDGWDPASTIRITSVRYSDGDGYTPTCHDTDVLGHRLSGQLITLEVSSPDGRARSAVAVAKGVSL